MSDLQEQRRPLDRRIITTSLSLSLLLLALIAGSASAQSIDIPAMLTPDAKGPPTMVNLQYGHNFKTDVDDAGTEFARDTALFSVARRIKLSEKASFFAIGSYTFYQYNFSSNSGNNYQWDDVHRLVIGGMFGYDLNDRWRLVGGGIVRSWGEGGADFGDSVTGGLLGGFDYHPSSDFSIGLLVGAFSSLEDSLALLPVPTLKWNFAEDWKLQVGIVAVIDPGVGAEVTWQVSETVAIGTGATFQNRRYRLSDKNRVLGGNSRTDEGGIGEDSGLPVFASIQWKPTPRSSLDLAAGVVLAGNVRVESDTGGRISDDDFDPAPFVKLRAVIAF